MMTHQFMYPKVTPVRGGKSGGATGNGTHGGTPVTPGSRRTA
jgi:hypothetical protein